MAAAPPDIPKEAGNLAKVVLYRAECHLTAERFNANVHFFVGMAAAGLAAAAGGTAFAGQTIVAGVSGIAAAALTGFLTVYKPDERSHAHAKAAREHKDLYDRIDLFFRLGWTKALEGERETMATAAPASDQLAAHAHFTAEAAKIDVTSFAVPRRLCSRTEQFRAAHEEWYPPNGGEFDKWEQRRWSAGKSRWRRFLGAPGRPAA